ncbi:GDSL-type esterase/lipase family protein [Polaribacter septentrionalilitoris]|uniref:GDSL-type esterase/lipase family protein n=1 Tax=Polaribacter septentrionalilitoris TaxID=2494657 RepID=UPI00135B8CCA|nr:GDSL-type esterase/lipase family protein [Polaribacter septentrionalilitoris]
MFWFHDDLLRLENKIQNLEFNPKLVFYGSSTFTLWDEIETIFEDYNPINLGFGGSTLAACTWFFDRVFKNIKKPESIVIYAGDNDLGDGRHPEETVLFLENLLAKIRAKYGNIKCTCISIKPSIARRHLQESIHYTNACIKSLMHTNENFFYINIFNDLLDEEGNPDEKYFEEDGLHFNAEGYKVLLEALQKKTDIFPEKVLQRI